MVVQSLLPRPISDHHLVLSNRRGIRGGLISFRFENMWLRVEGFKELVKERYVGFRVVDSFCYI